MLILDAAYEFLQDIFQCDEPDGFPVAAEHHGLVDPGYLEAPQL